MTTSIAEVDLKIGGKYRLGMHSPESGNHYIVAGVYHTVDPPEKLVYTWRWEGMEQTESLVTVIFHAKGQNTELELIHERFSNSEERDKHREGWSGCLEQLSKAL